MPKQKSDLYMANQAAAINIDGEELWVKKGDLVRAGHPLLKGRDWLFDPAEGYVRFDVEQATAAPGEKRGQKK